METSDEEECAYGTDPSTRTNTTTQPSLDNDERTPILTNNGNRKIVFPLYFSFAILHGFMFYSVYWRIIPYVRSYLPESQFASDLEPSIAAQIFLLVNYMCPILTGLIGDLKHTRYRVILVSSSLFSVSFAFVILATYLWSTTPFRSQGYAFGMSLFALGSTSGITMNALVVFGIEQLSNPEDAASRTVFIRWSIWFYEIGRFLAVFMYYYEKDRYTMTVTSFIILAASIVSVPLFLIGRRFYRYNRADGAETFRDLSKAIKLNCGCRDNDDYDDEMEWDEPQEEPEMVVQCRRALMRRTVFLIIIFFLFGAYRAASFFANLIYPFQILEDSQVFGPHYGTASNSIAIIIALPILDIIFRRWKFHGEMLNFCLCGIGMLLAMISMAISEWNHDLTRLEAQFVLYGFAEMCFLIGGYELAFRESLPKLRGMTMALFVGLGAFFGAMIYVVWLLVPPMGVSPQTWKYAQIIVSSILGITLVGLYIPLVVIYRRARDAHIRLKGIVTRDFISVD